MLGLAFAILNSWTALSASLSLALPSGGAVGVIWGLITAGVCNLCLAASLAEFLSAYPTAGGQYHWVAVVAWKQYVPLLSWITGWINVSGWIALVASGGLLGSQLIVGVISLFHENYVPERWHQFLIYIGYTITAFLINAFMNDLLPYVNKAAITWSISGFIIISITVLACASPNYASARFVFADFINQTGWPDGIAWLLGLLQGGLGLTGYDAGRFGPFHLIWDSLANQVRFDSRPHDRRNPKRCGRRAQDYDLLRRYRHIHWIHLLDVSTLRLWWRC
jgi:choline transport protein